jgi:hypothetical protein
MIRVTIPTIPARAESVRVLAEQVVDGGEAPCLFRGTGTHREWTSAMLDEAIVSGADHLVFFDDDARLCAGWREPLEEMIRAYPGEVLGLGALHPRLPEMLRRGHHWACTHVWTVGWGVVWPRDLLMGFRVWRRDPRTSPLLDAHQMDHLANVFLRQAGRLCYHPIPTIAQQELEPGEERSAFATRESTCVWGEHVPRDRYEPGWYARLAAPPPILDFPHHSGPAPTRAWGGSILDAQGAVAEPWPGRDWAEPL